MKSMRLIMLSWTLSTLLMTSGCQGLVAGSPILGLLSGSGGSFYAVTPGMLGVLGGLGWVSSLLSGDSGGSQDPGGFAATTGLGPGADPFIEQAVGQLGEHALGNPESWPLSQQFGDTTVAIVTNPEPASVALFGGGLAAFAFFRRRRRT